MVLYCSIRNINMEDYREKTIKEIVSAIRRIVRSIYLDSKKMVKSYNITGPQGLVIKSIMGSAEPLSASDISKLIKVSTANMTGIIDRLESKGLIEKIKKDGDRRVSLIKLTEKGKEVGVDIPDPIEEKLLHGLHDLDATEIYGILAAFQKVVYLLDADQVSTGPLDPNPAEWLESKK